jgi:hypothetical protein
MIGTLLWNDCTELMISRGHNPEDVLLLGKVRALAFAVLNMAVLPDLQGCSWSLIYIEVILSDFFLFIRESQGSRFGPQNGAYLHWYIILYHISL